MKLSPKMTLDQFDRGYWFAVELKAFGRSLGLSSAGNLRKDELELAIRRFLQTGELKNPARRALKREGVKDIDRGLRLDLPVVLYTNDRETKDFLEREMQKLSPGLKRRSGMRYRFNRWREEQLASGKRLTYRDLVAQYTKMNQSSKPFQRIAVGRYINFLADFLSHEKNPTHAQARAAWRQLKKLDAPKDYASWVKARGRR